MVRVLGIALPFTVVRAWHTILQIYWFFILLGGLHAVLPAAPGSAGAHPASAR